MSVNRHGIVAAAALLSKMAALSNEVFPMEDRLNEAEGFLKLRGQEAFNF